MEAHLGLTGPKGTVRSSLHVCLSHTRMRLSELTRRTFPTPQRYQTTEGSVSVMTHGVFTHSRPS